MIKFELINDDVFVIDIHGNREKPESWARFITISDFGQIEQYEHKPDACRYVDGTFTGDFSLSKGKWLHMGIDCIPSSDLAGMSVDTIEGWNPAGYTFEIPSAADLLVQESPDMVKIVGVSDIDDHIEAMAINNMVRDIHSDNVAAGWWKDDSNIAEKLCLVHSEISEAMEGYRKDLMDDHLPHREMMEVELSDAVIRIFDLAGRMGFDLGSAILEKREYNKHRADHKPENRAKAGGKKF